MALERGRLGVVLSLLLLIAGLLAVSIPYPEEPSPAPPESEPRRETRPLEPGAVANEEIQGREVHAYRLRLDAGQAVQVTLDPGRKDLVLSFLDTRGREVLRIDTSHSLQNLETLYMVTDGAGDYGLEIRSDAFPGKPARYRLSVGEPHSASDTDRLKADAMAAFSRGEYLWGRGEKRYVPEAVIQFERARILWEKAREPERALATRYRLGRSLQSIGQWRAALLVLEPVLKEVQSRKDPLAEARVLDRIGRNHIYLGELNRAHELLKSSLMLFQQEEYRPGEADVLSGLGLVYRRRGDFAEGLRLQRKALERWESLGGLPEQVTLRYNIGEIHLADGHPDLALEEFNRALEISEVSTEKASQALLLRGKGTAYSQLGQDKVHQALDSMKQAIEVSRREGDRHTEIISMVRLGDIFTRADRLAEAERRYREALRLSVAEKDDLGEATARGNLGHVLDLLGREQEALISFGQAQAIFERLRESAAVGKQLKGSAEAALDLGDLNLARSKIEEAIRILESLESASLRISSFSDRRACYELYVEILMRLHEQAKDAGFDVLAFEAAEAAHSRQLLAAVSESRADSRSVDPGLQKRKRELERRISALELERWSLPRESSRRRDEIDRRVGDLKSQLDLARRELQGKAPERYRQPLTLPEVQRNLGPNTLLLAYFLGEDRSFLWEVTSDHFAAHVLGGRAEIKRSVEKARKSLIQRPQPSQPPQTGGIEMLSRTILEPVAGRMRKPLLLIVPDGDLHLIPFAALIDPLTPDQKGSPSPGLGSLRFLVLDHEVVVDSSVSLAVASREALASRPPAPREIAIFAAPIFDGRDPRVSFWRGGAVAASSLEHLRFTLDEAKAIAGMVPPGKSFLAHGFAANRAAALHPDLALYRILHFATHGMVRERPDLSGIVLSLVDERGDPQDGFLRAFEIYDLELSSDLVVLSACETGLDSDSGGLVDAFLHAGARQVMASLWRVKDSSTADLMQRFYEGHLRNGLLPAQALRQAQIAMTKGENSHPYHWAGFVLHGDWQ